MFPSFGSLMRTCRAVASSFAKATEDTFAKDEVAGVKKVRDGLTCGLHYGPPLRVLRDLLFNLLWRFFFRAGIGRARYSS